jgi:hypothetical protein
MFVVAGPGKTVIITLCYIPPKDTNSFLIRKKYLCIIMNFFGRVHNRNALFYRKIAAGLLINMHI